MSMIDEVMVTRGHVIHSNTQNSFAEALLAGISSIGCIDDLSMELYNYNPCKLQNSLKPDDTMAFHGNILNMGDKEQQ